MRPPARVERLVEKLLARVDPREVAAVRDELASRRNRPERLPEGRVVLVGHRAAGKSALLPLVAELLGRRSVDLDAAIELAAGEPLRALFVRDVGAFRRKEREVFSRTPADAVVAAGGGFLANHADLLRDAVPVLVPVSAQTYRERLRADSARPRLHPSLTLEEELDRVFREREALHAAARPWSLARFLSAALAERFPQRVVTLPPSIRGAAALAWARRALASGADLLELRSDLHPPEDLDAPSLAEAIPLLCSERDAALPSSWTQVAARVDRPLSPGELDATLVSFHASEALTPDEAEAGWRAARLPDGAWIKHVEPLGVLASADRLFETQDRLGRRFGAERVTVLATGALALPWRCLLARRNALDYLALDPEWAAAPGQRLLGDAVREGVRPFAAPRRGILGARIAHSRSPRVRARPFDRIELPPEAPLGELLDALEPHYDGFAVTSPFKKAAAAHVEAPFPAVNTLVRRAGSWDAFNTDVEGARAVLLRMGGGPVTVLGDGGATAALRVAAANEGRALEVVPHAQAGRRLSGTVVWTWPPAVDAPPGLSLAGARVAVITYGAPAVRVAERIRALGGTPVRLGACWFVAQARGQQRLWS